MAYRAKQWHYTKGHKHVFKMARKMGKHPRAAANIRIRYLCQQIEELLPHDHPIAQLWIVEALEEIYELIKKGKTPVFAKESSNSLTDEMIEIARDFPIEDLVDFQRGKAYSWCHQDTRPSLCHWRKANKATCFVCDKKFDSIAVLMERDGYSFIDAVRALQ